MYTPFLIGFNLQCDSKFPIETFKKDIWKGHTTHFVQFDLPGGRNDPDQNYPR